MIANKNSFEPLSDEALPRSARVHVQGKIHQDLRVPFREITLNPTKSMDGRSHPNDPVRVYDCSGPWGDAEFQGDVEQGLPPLRRNWILARGDVQETQRSWKPRLDADSGALPVFSGPSAKPLRANPGKIV